MEQELWFFIFQFLEEVFHQAQFYHMQWLENNILFFSNGTLPTLCLYIPWRSIRSDLIF